MKVSFTAKEYARLLELVHLGLWTVTGHQGADTPAFKRYAELEQKLLDLATPFGCADLVTTNPEGGLAPSKKLLENEPLKKIEDEFANDTFWNEFVNRLADRDYASEQARSSMIKKTPGVEPPPTPEQRLKQIEDDYWAHFEKHDLAHVVILRGGEG